MALWCPGVDGGNLVLERGVDQAVTGEGGLLGELWGDDYGFKHLTAAT